MKVMTLFLEISKQILYPQSPKPRQEKLMFRLFLGGLTWILFLILYQIWALGTI